MNENVFDSGLTILDECETDKDDLKNSFIILTNKPNDTSENMSEQDQRILNVSKEEELSQVSLIYQISKKFD